MEKAGTQLLVPSSRGGVAARSRKAAKPPQPRRRGGQKCLWPPRPLLWRVAFGDIFL